MLGMIARRLLSLIPVLLVVSFVVFMLVELVPGDAATTVAGGVNATPEQIAEVREELGLDRPVLERYGDWLVDAVQLDFGTLVPQPRPAATTVAEDIELRLPVSLGLALAGLFVAIIIGVPLGILAGMRPGAAVDRSSVTGTSFGLAIPNFVLAFLLITGVRDQPRLVPRARLHQVHRRPARVALEDHAAGDRRSACSRPHRSPARPAPRSSTCCSRTTSAPRSRWDGTRRTTVVKYAFKNAAIPTVTVLGLQLAALIGGVVIIEQIFSIPGLGTYMLRALTLPDVPVIQAVTITFVVIYVVLNLLVDISYGYLNPRVRAAS